MNDDLARKRVQKLTDKGIDHLEAGRYQEALEVAAELEDAKGPLAFYLAGEAYAGLNDIKVAVATMRRGVLKNPGIWMNWFFLGIYLRRLKKNQEALAAYHQALLCPGVDADMVRLNMAILAVECRDYEGALNFLSRMENVSNRWGFDGTRVLALEGVGRIAEAAELAELFLKAKPEGDKEYNMRVGYIAAALARIRLQQGGSTDEIRSFLLHCLQEYGSNSELLGEIRRLKELRYSKESKYYRFVIRARLPVGHPWYRDTPDYFAAYGVVSDSEHLAIEMINEFESAGGVESVEVLRFSADEGMPEEAMGVYWISEKYLP